MLPIRTDLATRARYSQGAGIFRIIPAAVGRPADGDELACLLRWAAERQLPVTPRGAGTAMDGGNIGEGLLLDLTAFGEAGPVIDAERRVVRVDAGVALARLGDAAANHGLRLGPDPSSAAWATVGGAIATNAAGARSHRLGAIDRWVRAMDLVTADGPLTLDRDRPPNPDHPGVDRFHRVTAPLLERHRSELLARLPQVRKDTAGYRLAPYLRHGHLLDLMIGSEGTLGVITHATLRLEPIPMQRATLQLVLGERGALTGVLAALAPVEPVAVEFFDRSFLRLVAERAVDRDEAATWRSAAAIVLVDLEADSPADLARRLAQADDAVAGRVQQMRIARERSDIEALWELRHRASPLLAGLTDGRRSLQVVEDGCVPPASLDAYLDAVDAACAAAGIDAVMFGHAGDGHVHVNLLPDLRHADWLTAVRQVFRDVTAAQLALHGTPAGEHGAGRLRGALLDRFLGADAMAGMSALKRAFDPAAVFNPGVILAAPADPFTTLKVGVTAAKIPLEVEAALQRIEAERRWGESRW